MFISIHYQTLKSPYAVVPAKKWLAAVLEWHMALLDNSMHWLTKYAD